MTVSDKGLTLYRALEKVPRKGKMFDPAENGGHNLLEEMSLLELRQRLAYTQQRLLVRLHPLSPLCLLPLANQPVTVPLQLHRHFDQKTAAILAA